MQMLYDDAFIQIVLHKDLRCLEYEWKKFTETEEFKEAQGRVADYVDQHHCNKLLINLVNMQVLPQEAQAWAETVWIPMMIEKGISNFVIVEPRSGIAKMTTEAIDKTVEDSIREAGAMTLYFSDLGEARSWVAALSFKLGELSSEEVKDQFANSQC